MWVFLCPIVTKLNYFTLFYKIIAKKLGIDKKMYYLCTIIKIRDMEEDNTQYFNDEWNNYRQLSCQCNLPRPNSFTGNCTSCNKIIKPIIDKDADKHTK